MKNSLKVYALLIVVALLLPVFLAGQRYPQTHYLTGLVRRADGGNPGPDWWMTDSYAFTSSDNNPLLVTEIYRHHQGWMYDFEPSNYEETWDFNGQLTFYPDYYILKSPLTLEPGVDPTRIIKMNEQGYLLEDNWYGYGDAHYKAWHYYNQNLKLNRTVIKQLNPQKWWDSCFTLDDLGRRVEELQLCSSDSLTWVNSRRNQYFYSGEQFGPGYQFENNSLLLPEYILNAFTACVPYMNDIWIISHVIHSGANSAGIWYPPETWDYNTLVDDDQVVVSTMWGYNVFNSAGLLTTAAVPAGEGVPSYDFYYAQTTGSSAEEDLLPPAKNLSVWPNPVRRDATLRFPEKASGPVTLSVYNIRGQLVKQEICHPTTGDNGTSWQALDAHGNVLQNGIYLIRAQGEGFDQSARIMVLK